MGNTEKKKMPKLNEKQKKIINIVVTSVQIVLVLCAVIFSIVILVNPTTNEISDNRTVLMPVRSDSMAGTEKDSFKAGDAVIIRTPGKDNKRFDPAKLKVGDIITFTNPNPDQPEIKYITHRIVEVVTVPGDDTTASYYVTKGDANVIQDPNIYPARIVGLYKGKLVGFGKLILFLQTPKYFLLVIILPLALLFIYNLVMFIMMFTQQRAEKIKASAVADTEERREQIIAEYLAQQQEASNEKTGSDETTAGDESEDTK